MFSSKEWFAILKLVFAMLAVERPWPADEMMVTRSEGLNWHPAGFS